MKLKDILENIGSYKDYEVTSFHVFLKQHRDWSLLDDYIEIETIVFLDSDGKLLMNRRVTSSKEKELRNEHT